MIALCREAGIPTPEFRQEGGEFVQTLWRSELAEASTDGIGQVAGQVGGEEEELSALAAGLVERTAPDKPTSRLQRHRLTEQGRACLATREPGK